MNNLKTKVALESLQAGIVSSMESWSLIDDMVPLVDGALDTPLPSVVVAGLPAGCTIVRVEAMLRFREVENTFAGANAVDGAACPIQLQDSVPCAFTTCITIPDDFLAFGAAGFQSGFTVNGSINMLAIVDGNDTYAFQWDAVQVNSDFIKLMDVQTGLRIYFRP